MNLIKYNNIEEFKDKASENSVAVIFNEKAIEFWMYDTFFESVKMYFVILNNGVDLPVIKSGNCKVLNKNKYPLIEEAGQAEIDMFKNFTNQLEPLQTIYPYQEWRRNALNEIREFVTSQNIEYQENIEINNYPIDFYFPKNNLAVLYRDAVECKGISKKLHREISANLELNGIRTIFCWSWEWIIPKKQKILMSVIKNALNITMHKYYARNCEVRVVPVKEAKEFCEKNSPHGFRGASVHLGLYLKDSVDIRHDTEIINPRLLMLKSFGYNYFGHGLYDCEVIRVTTEQNCSVVGGSSKLFNFFLNNYLTVKISNKELEYDDICYYVDVDHYSGNSLTKLGFELLEWTGSGFMNINASTGQGTHREPQRHAEIKAMVHRGELIEVFNTGTKVFIWRKPEFRNIPLKEYVSSKRLVKKKIKDEKIKNKV